MIAQLIGVTKRALGLTYPGRTLAVFPDDTFLVSFPKSGNTWARFLIANLRFPEHHPNFGNIDELIPAPLATTHRKLNRVPRPRIIKSHDCFDPRFKKVIYIVRDPRDVVLSQYHFHRKRELVQDASSIEAFTQRFLAGETAEYGSWGDHVTTWLGTSRNKPAFLLIRYEDLVADTYRELSKIASFLKVAASPDQIALAVARSSSDEMRKLEKKQVQNSVLTRGRQDIGFVRSAKSGEWKQALPEHCVEAIEHAWGNVMTQVGYELVGKRNVKSMAVSVPAGSVSSIIRDLPAV